MRAECSSDQEGAGICEGPAELLVFVKGTPTPMQRLELERLDLILDDRGEPLVNSSDLYEYQGTLNVGDFDFDGHEDFAVQDSEQGSYGGPTYAVFLFDPRAETFVHSEALSQLTRETLGFFQVDARKKRLVTFAKSGCCWHETSEYAVVKGSLVLMASLVEDAREDGYVLETRRWRERGRWRTATRRIPQASSTPNAATSPSGR
jgi:hypothetical protein